MKTELNHSSDNVCKSLLMTATIKVGETPFLNLTDEESRIFEYVCSFLCWIYRASWIDKIVFCENSNSGHSKIFHMLAELGKKNGKQIELLTFKGNKEAQKLGKGFGEGETIKYALKESHILKETPNFYKITGKNFIIDFDPEKNEYLNAPNIFFEANFDRISKFHELSGYLKSLSYSTIDWVFEIKSKSFLDNMILKPLILILIRNKVRYPGYKQPSIKTLFFRANKEFYIKNILNSYLNVDDPSHYYLEYAIGDSLFPLRERIYCSNKPLKVMGRNGTSGGIYYCDFDDEIKRKAMALIHSS